MCALTDQLSSEKSLSAIKDHQHESYVQFICEYAYSVNAELKLIILPGEHFKTGRGQGMGVETGCKGRVDRLLGAEAEWGGAHIWVKVWAIGGYGGGGNEAGWM